MRIAAATEPVICVVEDDPAIAGIVVRAARDIGYRVLVSASAEAALELILQVRPALVVADLNLPRLGGQDLLQELRAHGLQCPVLFISGDRSIESVESALRVASSSFLPKPFTKTELSHAIWTALRQA